MNQCKFSQEWPFMKILFLFLLFGWKTMYPSTHFSPIQKTINKNKKIVFWRKKQVKQQTEPTDIKVESFLFMQSLNLRCACNQGSAGLTEILVTSSGFQRNLGVWRRFELLPIHSVRQSVVRLTDALFTFSQLEGKVQGTLQLYIQVFTRSLSPFCG